MNDITTQIVENPSESQVDAIRKPLREYNMSRIGEYHTQEFVINAMDGDEFLGGAHGFLQFGWLCIELLVVADKKRRRGIGTKILDACERFAIEKGVYNARLNTGSFQALDFYLKNGYEVFAKLDVVVPNGTEQINYFLKKAL